MSEKGFEFDEFKEALAQQIREYLPEEYKNGTIQFQEVTKSGIGEITGMTIRTPDSRIAPCLYIDSAFEEHQKYDIPVSKIAESLGKTFGEALLGSQSLSEDNSLRTLMSKGFEWDAVKESCFIKAVPLSDNGSYLQNLPHRMQGDIAAVYQISLGDSDQGKMSVSITNELAQKFGVSEEQLYHVAVQNMMEQNPPHIASMEDVMMGIMTGEGFPAKSDFGEELSQLPEADSMVGIPMNVLSNTDSMNGAASLFSAETMDALAAKYPDGFYILPSSIHEVLIVAKGENSPSLDELNAMVKEINVAEVAPQDRLSDFVHEYDPASRSLFIAGTEAPSKAMKAAEQAQKQEEQKQTPHKR
ncbi:MAG: DUF5688 family protein [Lachnospiraceae bacterium]|nr:DUF5688 family protein [Lachnospiraceae bacterium]